MTNRNPFSDEQMEKMFKMASRKLGMSPEKLKKAVSDPKSAGDLLDRVGGNKAKSALNDPDSLKRMIDSNPEAKKLLNELLGDKHHG